LPHAVAEQLARSLPEIGQGFWAARRPAMGGRDHTVPEAITKSTLKQYRGSAAVTDLAEFPDRGHSLTIDSGWRAVADDCLSWLAKQGL
jgi:hypothetical protein